MFNRQESLVLRRQLDFPPMDRHRGALPGQQEREVGSRAISGQTWSIQVRKTVITADHQSPCLPCNRSKGSIEEFAKDVDVLQVLPYPKYKRSALYDDIGLLKLSDKVEPTRRIMVRKCHFSSNATLNAASLSAKSTAESEGKPSS